MSEQFDIRGQSVVHAEDHNAVDPLVDPAATLGAFAIVGSIKGSVDRREFNPALDDEPEVKLAKECGGNAIVAG